MLPSTSNPDYSYNYIVYKTTIFWLWSELERGHDSHMDRSHDYMELCGTAFRKGGPCLEFGNKIIISTTTQLDTKTNFVTHEADH